MQDITPFLSNSTIRPELCHVYVNKGYAVATDSFRLIEIKLDDFCTKKIKNGYYKPDKWQKMYKAYKKKDIDTFMQIIEENNIYKHLTKHFKYPDYKKIIPKEEDLSELYSTFSFNSDYLVDFIRFAQTEKVTRTDVSRIDLSKIKTDGKMIYFGNETTKLLLMKLNN